MSIVLFPGQGSQRVGMGDDLFARFSNETAEASGILGWDVAELCRTGGDGRLSQTQYTQPALFVVSALAWLDRQRAVSEGEVTAAAPAALAGHSLGEYTALWAAGSFDFANGVRLVQRRGELMGRVAGGGMAAVIGLPPLAVRQLVDGSPLDVANYNSYEQTVIAGPRDELEAATPRLRDAGARHVVPLDVSAPFHSRAMDGVADELRAFLGDVPIDPPRVPVIANATALPYAPDAVRDTLARQATSPVRWIESIEYLLRSGERDFVEVGPGNVLTRLVEAIRRDTPFASD